MKTIIIYSTLLLCLVFLHSCNWDDSCKEEKLSEEEFMLFPYYENDSILVECRNSEGTLEYTTTMVASSRNLYTGSIDGNCDKYNISGYFISLDNIDRSIYNFIAIDIIRTGGYTSLTINFNNFEGEYLYFVEYGNDFYKVLDTITIDSILYEDVYVFEDLYEQYEYEGSDTIVLYMNKKTGFIKLTTPYNTYRFTNYLHN